MPTTPDRDARITELTRAEADLLDKLQRCIPPVDQHRHELMRVRAELDRLRQSAAGSE